MRSLLTKLTGGRSGSEGPAEGPSAPAAPKKLAQQAPSPAPIAVRKPDAAANETIDRQPDGESHFATFSEVPKFLSVMSATASVVKLTAEEKRTVAVIELAGRKALLIKSLDDVPTANLIQSIRGSLLSSKYIVTSGSAPRSVIAEIYSGSTADAASGRRGPSNVYMQTVHQWLEYAVENRATDIHLECLGSSGFVRVRIDGEVEPIRNEANGVYAGTFLQNCMATLYNNEQQKKSGSGSLFEADKNLYCMVPYGEIPGTTLKLRYQSITGNEGPKTILRLLHVNENAKTLTFSELGYAPSHIELWNQAMATPSGAVLIAGVTGSGKSTTQKSFIELNPAAPYMAIYTAEDPVEYPIRYTHQVPLQRDLANPAESARKYAEVIGALMRADLDICMVGEVRDRHSATAMQQLVETGHMGLGTVHAHLLSGIVPRLCNPEIGMSREVLTGPNMLTLLVYQALVPKLCPACCLSTDDALRAHEDVPGVVDVLDSLGLPVGGFKWKHPPGCSKCKHRGTVGLTVVAEMMMPSEEWLKPTREGRDPDAVEAYRSFSDGVLLSPDMTGKTVFEHTLYKAAMGQVDARQCQRFDNFKRFARRYQASRKAMASSS
jgi:general secretion pathway protein E